MHRNRIAGFVTFITAVGLCGTFVGTAPAAEVIPYTRLAGPTGVETSLEVAKYTWGTNWPVVYVASNRNPVDALPAATIGDGPVILTDGKTLNLGGVAPEQIVILGGTGAVSTAIENQAKSTLGESKVQRLWGANRNATAAAIAQRWAEVNGNPSVMYVTKNTGGGSPDAVAGSALRNGPILTFTNGASAAELASTIRKYRPSKVIALGGTGAVPESNLQAAATGIPTSRLAGNNRYETAYAIAQYAKGQKSGSKVYLASGNALKDAMVAGAAKDGVILLSPANGAGVYDKAKALGAPLLVVIGGNGVMPDAVANTAATGVLPKPKPAPISLANAPLGHRNAIKKARSYVENLAFSRQELYEQLLFDKFTEAEAQYAISNLAVDYNAEALEKARSYVENLAFSRQELYEQLLFDKFTESQAQYAVNTIYG